MAGLQAKEEYGELATAVSLTLAILRKCKQNTWPEMIASMEDGHPVTVKTLRALDLSEHQQLLIGRFTPVLDMLSIKPATVPAICPTCGYYILTSDTAPTKCLVTAGCTGKPFKVAVATGADNAPAEPEVAAVGAVSQEPREATADPFEDVNDLDSIFETASGTSDREPLVIEDDPFA